VRCFVSQPGTGNQALAEAGSPNASRSKGFEPKTLIEKRKRAAGIEPASSAWKAEVLPLNYARKRTHNLAGSGGGHRLRPIQSANIIHQSDCSDQDRRSQQLITMTTGVHRFDEAESNQAIQANQPAQSPTLIVAKDGPI
jgi:hypothetical protein